jgi:aspartate/methionine/tyrosine aminotransferase
VLPGSWLEALAGLARAKDWWLVSDEVYEDFVYAEDHVPLAPLAPERTLSAHSFSKAYGMAGNRVGYLVGPPAWIEQAHKLGTHSFYNAPVACQVAALRALEGGAGWQRAAWEQYREVGAGCASLLGLPPPGGSTFLFVDVESALDARGLAGLLEDCFEAGVLVAPGSSSGSDYPNWVRVCYTAMPPEPTLEGVGRLARLLGAG